jgi:hypothetical protein
MSQSTLLLARHVFACTSEGQVVLLDLKKDRYLSLAPNVGPLFQQVLHSPLRGDINHDVAETFINEMLNEGIFTRDHMMGKTLSPPNIATPQYSLVDDDAALQQVPFNVLAVGRLAMSAIYAKWTLRFRTFEQLVESVASLRQSNLGKLQTIDLASTRRAVLLFRQLGPMLFDAHNACVFESVALLHFLARSGSSPHWVFGVRARPFAAHCWLQHEDAVINDTVDHVSTYTPIMSI